MLNKTNITMQNRATTLCQEDIIPIQGVAKEVMVERD
jgi:hypothetical protein